MIYDLQDIGALENDLKFILKRLDAIYQVGFEGNKINISPQIDITTDAYFTTDENTIEFNEHIPAFKSLHKEMYSFIESLSWLKFSRFDPSELEAQFTGFKEFRLLNNRFKHPEKKKFEINFTKVVHIFEKKFNLVCNFHYPEGFKCLMYSDFIVLFFNILFHFGAITINQQLAQESTKL